MRRRKVLLTGIVFLFCCSFSPIYRSSVKLDPLIPAKVSIKVNLPLKLTQEASFSLFRRIFIELIIKSITNDLKKNLFPNLEDSNPDILVVVDINKLSYNEVPWGCLWFPFVLFGAPTNKIEAEADVNLKILRPDGNLIKNYNSTAYEKRWTGLFYNTSWSNEERAFGLILKDALEKIKKAISRDREEIISAIGAK